MLAPACPHRPLNASQGQLSTWIRAIIPARISLQKDLLDWILSSGMQQNALPLLTIAPFIRPFHMHNLMSGLQYVTLFGDGRVFQNTQAPALLLRVKPVQFSCAFRLTCWQWTPETFGEAGSATSTKSVASRGLLCMTALRRKWGWGTSKSLTLSSVPQSLLW